MNKNTIKVVEFNSLFQIFNTSRLDKIHKTMKEQVY